MAEDSSSLSFLKAEATANDFIIAESSAFGAPLSTSRISEICDRHRGVGADGFISLKIHSPTSTFWNFSNSDGSLAEMCGNATRAVGAYWEATGRSFPLSLETARGLVQIQKDQDRSGWFRSSWSLPSEQVQNIEPGVQFFDSGVQHFIIDIQELVGGGQIGSGAGSPVSVENRARLLPLIEKFRWHSAAGPRGSNVSFHWLSPDGLRSFVTFERGVEDFTWSCGTGAIAVAAALSPGKPFSVRAPGGLLRIQFAGESVALSGPARVVFAGRL